MASRLPAEGDGTYLRRASAEARLGRAAQSAARGRYVVYQEDKPAGNPRGGGKGAADISPALALAQADLRRRRPHPPQQAGLAGEAEAFREWPGEQRRLVVAPLAFPIRVEGHRHD